MMFSLSNTESNNVEAVLSRLKPLTEDEKKEINLQ
jgi:hypothetical protein